MFSRNKKGSNLYAEEVDLNMLRMCGKPNCLVAFSIPFPVLYVSHFPHKFRNAKVLSATKYIVILFDI